MRRFSLVLALSLILPHAARAEDTPSGIFGRPDVASDTAAFRAMLHRIPALMVSPGVTGAEIGFGDLAAARGLPGPVPRGRLPAETLSAARAMPPGSLVEALGFPAGEWRARVGFAPADIEQVILYGAPPLLGGVYRLAPGIAAGVPAALEAQGYAPATESGVAALAVGADGRMDLAARAPADPFRGPLGRSSRVQVEGDLLRHGSTWPMLGALQGAGAASARDEPLMAAMVGMLEGLDRGVLLRAYLVPDAMALSTGDPVAAVTGGGAGGSVLVWHSLLLADFSTGAEATAALVLSLNWPESEALEGLVQPVERLWQEGVTRSGASFASMLGEDVEVEARRGPGGMVLLRLVVTGPVAQSVAGLAVNRGFDAIYRAVMMRELVFLP
ncbi:hypothetical protein [Pararhodobacter aggregans]|uniref:Uncharacterized protein n=1 Tax=Pararhodobacter aggregans TaxID=404875 RepID=A0A2T7UR23_9RHOB|nr:hypothetical protein [Pararhodobacter aggregans]PTX02016.1 hypothetical protein C8N33_106235 [Pararhodobacter aggregans]PVE47195.1 hypothetical protein DDE23_13205 [Pararhodobacter aggregans]